MTRAECEAKLIEHMEAMLSIYHEYNPDGKYLSAYCIVGKDGASISVNNEYYDNDISDGKFPIDCHKCGGEIHSFGH